jgi:methionyl-tRNA formyltransferase
MRVAVVTDYAFGEPIVAELVRIGVEVDCVLIPQKPARFARSLDVVLPCAREWTPSGLTQWLNEVCATYSIPLITSVSINSEDTIGFLKQRFVQCVVTAICPEILSDAFLSRFEHTINVHPSLLPNGKGPDPVFWMLREDTDYFGVTIHRTTKAIDSGPVLAQKRIEVSYPMNRGDVYWQCANVAATLMRESLDKLVQKNNFVHNSWEDTETSSNVSFPMVFKKDACLNDVWTVKRFLNCVRAAQPWANCYLVVNDQSIEVVRAEKADGHIGGVLRGSGCFLCNDDGLFVRLPDGVVRLEELQVDGHVVNSRFFKILDGQLFRV